MQRTLSVAKTAFVQLPPRGIPITAGCRDLAKSFQPNSKMKPPLPEKQNSATVWSRETARQNKPSI